jgi:hypothetical protein
MYVDPAGSKLVEKLAFARKRERCGFETTLDKRGQKDRPMPLGPSGLESRSNK